MNIDFLPITSSLPESGGGVLEPASPTLTLQLALAPRRASREEMSGTARGGVDLARTRRSGSLRASVLPAEGSAFTITF